MTKNITLHEIETFQQNIEDWNQVDPLIILKIFEERNDLVIFGLSSTATV